jgi:hypothetical protein
MSNQASKGNVDARMHSNWYEQASKGNVDAHMHSTLQCIWQFISASRFPASIASYLITAVHADILFADDERGLLMLFRDIMLFVAGVRC